MQEPERIGKYTVAATLGSGGMATVYRARDPDLQRDVALKVLHPHLCGREESRVRFRREARAVARLRHPNVLEVYDAGEEGGRPYIVSELVEGGSLESWARERSPVPPEVAAAIGLRIAEGLHAAHRAGIIHRDLKPGNILMGPGGQVKIADFGIAQVIDIEHVTVTGQILGSPAFMSPEHLEGGTLDARADIFSFGTLLYWLLVGELPFTGANAHVVLRKVLDVSFPDPARARPEIGEQLAQILRTCLQKRAEERYASMADVASALRAFLALAGSTDVDSLLAGFESDPEGTRTAVRTRRDAAVLARCRDLRGTRGAEAEIRSLCGWVLAYDPQNAEAQAMVEETLESVAPPVGRIAVFAGVALAAAAALFLWMRSESREGAGTNASLEDVPGSARVVAAAAEAEDSTIRSGRDASRGEAAAEFAARDAAGNEPGTGPDVVPESPAAEAGDGVEDDVEPVEAAAEEAADVPDATAEPGSVRPPAEAAARAKRTVVFRPLPQNVAIRVDGASIGTFGPERLGNVTQMELTTGAHQFAFEPLSDCCYPATWTETIPPGDGAYPVVKKLQGRPARLVIDAGGADAAVDVLGRAIGHANEEIVIPFDPQDPLELRIRISVIFPGARPVVLPDQRVRAGERVVVRVSPPAAAPDGG